MGSLQDEGRSLRGSKLGQSNRVLVRQISCRHNRVCDSPGIETLPEAGVPAVMWWIAARDRVYRMMEELVVRMQIEGGIN